MMAGTSHQFSYMQSREVLRNCWFRLLQSHGKKISMLTSLEHKSHLPKHSPECISGVCVCVHTFTIIGRGLRWE